jgi:hypothetical protein
MNRHMRTAVPNGHVAYARSNSKTVDPMRSGAKVGYEVCSQFEDNQALIIVIIPKTQRKAYRLAVTVRSMIQCASPRTTCGTVLLTQSCLESYRFKRSVFIPEFHAEALSEEQQ